VDEVGNADLGACADPNHRFLSLTGVIIGWEHSRKVVRPEMDELKECFFNSHPDDPVIFHRKELVNRKYPFHALMDKEVESRFNEALLGYLKKWQYIVITIVIDKLSHIEKHKEWAWHPYHYCMTSLVERYVYRWRRIPCQWFPRLEPDLVNI
jgi:hypothetical protein